MTPGLKFSTTTSAVSISLRIEVALLFHFEVDSKAAFAAVKMPEIAAVAVLFGWACAHGITLRRLNLDHLRTHVGK